MCSLSHACCVDASACHPLDCLLLTFASHSPAGCCVAFCRVPLPGITFHHATASCVHPQPPSLFAPAGCCIAPLCTASASRRTAASRLTTGCVVVVTEAQASLPVIAIVALVHRHHCRCHVLSCLTLSPVMPSPLLSLSYLVVVVTRRPVAPCAIAIIIVVVASRVAAIIVDFVACLTIAIVVVVVFIMPLPLPSVLSFVAPSSLSSVLSFAALLPLSGVSSFVAPLPSSSS